MDSGNSTRPVKAKQTLLDWFGKTASKDNPSSHDNLGVDDSGKDPGSHGESEEPEALALIETPITKKVRTDDYIEIVDSDCDITEDEPVGAILSPRHSVTCCHGDTDNQAYLTCVISHTDISSSTQTLTVLPSSINSNVLVSGVKDSAQQTQMENLAEDIAAVATSLPIQPTNVRYPVTLYSNKPRSFNPEWFKLYPWLEYSVKQDACFCFLCHMFGSNGGMSTSKPEKAFTVLGFKD